jgi:HSF-type DNA-binding
LVCAHIDGHSRYRPSTSRVDLLPSLQPFILWLSHDACLLPYIVYQDHSEKGAEWIATRLQEMEEATPKKSHGGTKETFPLKLHDMLDGVNDSGHSSIVRWLAHGRAFKVFDKDRFETVVLPRYFRFQSTFASFQRQLNIYGFTRLTGGRDKNAYYNEMFLRGRRDLCRLIPRNRSAPFMKRRSFDPTSEPDFSRMRALPDVVSPAVASNMDASNSVTTDLISQLQRQQQQTHQNYQGSLTSPPTSSLDFASHNNNTVPDLSHLLFRGDSASTTSLPAFLEGTASLSGLGQAGRVDLSLSDLVYLRSRSQASSAAVQRLLGGPLGMGAPGNFSLVPPQPPSLLERAQAMRGRSDADNSQLLNESLLNIGHHQPGNDAIWRTMLLADALRQQQEASISGAHFFPSLHSSLASMNNNLGSLRDGTAWPVTGQSNRMIADGGSGSDSLVQELLRHYLARGETGSDLTATKPPPPSSS